MTNSIKSIQERDIFPEIKQNIKDITQVKIYKGDNLESKDGYIKLLPEKVKKSKVVYPSQWIRESDLENLVKAKGEIEKHRYERLKQKQTDNSKIINKKEKKFNKIYDESYYPKNKRKEAYKYFVLNSSIYLKNINKQSIEYFISEKSAIETKDFIKLMKKDLKVFCKQSKEWILDDFALKKIEYIPVSGNGFSIKRGVEVLYLQKKEIKKIRNKFKNKPTGEIVDYFINSRFEQNKNKEEKFIHKIYDYIDGCLSYEKSNKDLWESAFKKAIKKYNKEESLEVFLFEYFVLINEKLNLFSENQRSLFKVRKKFRNKVFIDYKDSSFRLPVFLDFDNDIRGILISHYHNEDELKNKIVSFNESLMENKKEIYLNTISRAIKKSLKNIAYYSERNYDFKRLSSKPEGELQALFLNDFAKIFSKEINRTTDYLKKDIDEKILDSVEESVFEDLKGLIKSYLIKEIIEIDYKESFPLARGHKRKIKFFMGETNSGKTYNAFNELVKAKSGIYLSPLRLLALEGQEEIEKRGQLCSMETGEEKDLKEGANFKSCTIEMLDINKFVESVVIDEIQMIKDPNRGWAWVQALIGAPANNIILAGSKEVLSVIKEIVAYTGDEIEVVKHKRKSPLIVEGEITKIEDVKEGTAIIAFSRRKVLEFREKLKDRSVSVIYGNLGPEVRKEEARKFREGETDILIATDAIAMGLNLPIEKIIFSTHEKTIRGEKVEISNQLVKQIAGRAGRYGIKNKGFVSALNGTTLKYVKSMIDNDIDDFVGKVPIMPNIEYLNKIKSVIKTDKLEKILVAFQKYSTFDSELFYSTELNKRIELSELIDEFAFDLNTGLLLSAAPVRENYEGGLDLFEKYISSVSEYIYTGEYKEISSPSIDKFKDKESTRDRKLLQEAEEVMHNLELYNWFSNKYDKIFFDMDGVNLKRNILNSFIINTFKEK